jgi:hypothetical protein
MAELTPNLKGNPLLLGAVLAAPPVSGMQKVSLTRTVYLGTRLIPTVSSNMWEEGLMKELCRAI